MQKNIKRERMKRNMSHPIEGLMTTAMENIKEMVDVNTIVGDAVEAPDGTVIIPISRVSFGFAAGGGEYGKESEKNDDESAISKTGKYPFAGGSGAGVSINPVAFMVVGQDQIRLVNVENNSSMEKLLEILPELMKKAESYLKHKLSTEKRRKEDYDENKC